MDERIIQLRVGIVVVAAFCISVILVLYFSEEYYPMYTLYMETKAAPGVSKNTPIRKNGVLVGRVHKVENVEAGVRLTLRVKENTKLYSGEVCEIASSPLVGDTTLNIVQGDQLGTELGDGDAITHVKVGPSSQEIIEMVVSMRSTVENTLTSIGDAGQAIKRAGDEFSQVSQKLNSALGDDTSEFRQMFSDLRSMAAKAENALDNFNTFMTNANGLVGDQEMQAKLKSSLNSLPEVVDQAKLTLTDAQMTLAEFREASQHASKNLENLEGLTEPLGRDGEALVADFRSTMTRVNELSIQLEQFSRSLNNSEGTVGRLINDPELYEQLVETTENVKEISRRLVPVSNDMRAFSDKVSRDPGVLIRGAVDKRPNGLGIKGLY